MDAQKQCRFAKQRKTSTQRNKTELKDGLMPRMHGCIRAAWLAKPRKTPTQKTKQDLRMRLRLERMDAQERRGYRNIRIRNPPNTRNETGPNMCLYCVCMDAQTRRR